MEDPELFINYFFTYERTIFRTIVVRGVKNKFSVQITHRGYVT